jgi:hypothetical protein
MWYSAMCKDIKSSEKRGLLVLNAYSSDCLKAMRKDRKIFLK